MMSNADKIIIVDYVTKKPGFKAVYNDFIDVPAGRDGNSP